MTASTLAAQHLSQRIDDAIDLGVLHADEQRQAERAGIIGLGARQTETWLDRTIIGLSMNRDVVDLRADALRRQLPHHLGPRLAYGGKIDQHDEQMPSRYAV